MRSCLRWTLLAAVVGVAGQTTYGQNTSFGFQGRLKKAGNLQTTAADLKFRLYDADSGGNQVGSELVFEAGSAIPVTNGLFSVSLDFGAAAFDGTPLWLEVEARVPSGDPGGYVATATRQPLTAVPYAVHSLGPWSLNAGTGDLTHTGGSVGIGTAAPQTDLHVSNLSRASLAIETTDPANAADLEFRRSGVTKKRIRLSGSDDMEVFQGNGTNDSSINRMFMQFLSASGDTFFGGNVGIGTSQPGYLLSLGTFSNNNIIALADEPTGAMRGIGSITSGGGEHGIGIWADLGAITPGFTNTRMYVSANNGSIGIGTTVAPTAKLHINAANDGVNLLQMKSHNGDDFIIDTSGLVGLGTTSPTTRLHVAGSICYSGSLGACSDARYKDRITTLAGAFAKLSRLRGVQFDWRTKDFPDREFSDETQIGFVAQELLDVVPEVVQQGTDGYYTVDYGRLTPLLVEAIKELDQHHQRREAALTDKTERLSADTARLADENTRLQGTVNDLEHRLARLEARMAALAAD